MRAFIQSKNNEAINPNVFNAYYGLRDMGFECINFNSYEELIEHYHHRNEIIVGGIGIIRKRLKDFNIEPENIDYPKELDKYLGRKIWKSTINEIKPPIFIKSIEQKLLTGKVIRTPKDLIGCGSQENYSVFCSDILNIESEYRVFVRYGQILDIKHYKGNPLIYPDSNIIKSAIEDYTTAPNAYGIDFGVLNNGKTILVEVNDGWALGSYGLFPHLYAKFLLTRWADLTDTIDEYFFI